MKNKLSVGDLGEIQRTSKRDDFYNCPYCGDMRGRFGLLRDRGIFHCFNCNASGKLEDKQSLENYNRMVGKLRILGSEYPKELQLVISLPLGFHGSISRSSMAYRYLTKRGTTEKEMKQFEIGYTISGVFAHRIIVPIRENGLLKYFVGRTYINDSPKYMNAAAPKDGLIFKTFKGKVEKAVICEGVFDAMAINRAMPAISLLGKALGQKQIETIRSSAKSVVILLDSDASIDAFKAFNVLSHYMPTRIVFLDLVSTVKDPGEMTTEQLKEILR